MKLVTSCENPPIPWRKFDWVAFDEDQMSGVCEDPDCNCRQNLVRGWGETEEQAILAFVSDLLTRYDVCVPIIEKENCDESENQEEEQHAESEITTEDTEYTDGKGPTETFTQHCPGCAASR